MKSNGQGAFWSFQQYSLFCLVEGFSSVVIQELKVAASVDNVIELKRFSTTRSLFSELTPSLPQESTSLTLYFQDVMLMM